MMTTRYPPGLPAVPVDRWRAETIDSGGGDSLLDPDLKGAWVLAEIDAANASEAEIRALAWIDKDFEDDLRGAIAEASLYAPGRWRVRITWSARR